MLKVNDEISIPDDELTFTYVRSSGAGGQNVNKVATKAVLRWHVEGTASLPDDVRARFSAKYRARINDRGELVLTGERTRYRKRNADDCLEKLRAMILSVVAPPRRRKKTRPTRASRERRLRDKRSRAEKKRRRGPPSSDDLFGPTSA